MSAKAQSVIDMTVEGTRVQLRAAPRSLAFSALKRASNSTDDPEKFNFLVSVFLQPEKYGKFSDVEIMAAWPDVKVAQSPFSLGYDIARKGEQEQYRSLGEILSFQRINASGSSKEIAKKAGFWVKSPAHAVYLYEHLKEFGAAGNAVLDHLISENQYFRRVGRIRGPPDTLVTLSYEKETRNPHLSLLYRDAKMSDEEWAKLTDAERVSRLMGLIPRTTNPTSSEIIAPTSLLVSSAGGLRKETLSSDTSANGKHLFEFTHKGFEIDPDRLVTEMKTVSSLLKESDFHVHLSFELPKNYKQLPEFNHWLKQGNDFLYLRGLEEKGMHSSSLIELPPAPVPKGGGFDERWPDSIDAIDSYKYKYRNTGLRGQIYGSPHGAENMRIGLELRDATRDMNTWGATVKNYHSSVSHKVWERIPSGNRFVLEPKATKNEYALMLAHGLSEKFAKYIIDTEPMMGIPLQRFEEAKIPDYIKGGFRHADPALAKKIKDARERYLSELGKIEKNLHEMEARGETVFRDDVKGAIRMTMSEWAKEARVSELFGGI